MPSSDYRDALTQLTASSLSAANPEATVEQRDLEALAIRLFRTPQVQRALHEVAAAWLDKPATLSEEALSTFDAGIADFAFHCALEAANSDSNHPRVLRVECEPHRWFGMSVPGSRRGGNNADNSYRIVPVDGSGHIQIIGRVGSNPPADLTFTLIGNTTMSKTLGSLEFRDMDVDDDGVFCVEIDPDPPNGRRNHLRATKEAKYVFSRDSLTDWTTQQPNAMTARRLDPAAPPLGFDALLARAAQFVRDDSPYYSSVIDLPHRPPVNTFPPPFNPVQYGGLVSQRGSFGYFRLADDEALVVTVTTAEAAYLSLHAHDPWWRTIPFERHTSTLNLAQAVPDADGSYTFVIALQDPGVHNWIDTAGLHEGILYFRWQGLPPGTPHDGGPVVRKQGVVRLRELRAALPAGTRLMGSEERARQIAARVAAVGRRWLDH